MFDRVYMCSLYLFLFVIISIIQKRAYKTIRTPLSFFSLLWCIVGFFSNTSILGYDQPSMFVNFCIITGIIVFTTTFIYKVPGTKVAIKDNWEFGKYDKINYKSIVIINLVCWAFMIPRFKTAAQVISTEGFAFLRANLSNAEIGLSTGGVSDIVFGYMVEPILITTSILACFLLFKKQKSKKSILLFFYSIIVIITYAFTGAARGCLIKFAFCFFFVLIICKKNTIRNIIKMKIVRYSLILLVSVVLFITFQRGTFDNNDSAIGSIFKTFYVYYFSGPTYMTKLIEAQPQYGGFGRLLYGSATFGFITNFFSWFLIFLTGKSQGSLYTLGSVISNTYYTVAPNIRINAMYTCFYTFWIDWGYLGIFIGPIFIALFSAYLFRQVYSKRDYKNCVIYVFWLYTLVRTLFKLDTIGVDLTIVFLCMKLFVRSAHADEKC